MGVEPYGTAIHQAIASGSLEQMKKVAKAAETYLAEHGDIHAALEALKIEITKHEAKKK